MLITSVVWLALSLIGFFYARSEWSEARKDLQALGDSAAPGEAGDTILAEQLVRNARWLALSLLTFFLTSVPSFVLAAMDFGVPTEDLVRAYVVRVLLIAGLAFLVLAVADQRRSRFEGLKPPASKLNEIADKQQEDLDISRELRDEMREIRDSREADEEGR